MIEMINTVVTFLNTPSDARAFVGGVLASLAGTQWIKFLFPEWLPDRKHRLITMATAFCIAWAITMALWPKADANAFTFAVINGFVAPVSYPVVTFFLYKFYPGLEPILSARPRSMP